MEESKFFAEWTVRDVESDIQMLLAEIQCYLARKELEWDSLSSDKEWMQEMVQMLRSWSDEILRKAGFLDSDERS